MRLQKITLYVTAITALTTAALTPVAVADEIPVINACADQSTKLISSDRSIHFNGLTIDVQTHENDEIIINGTQASWLNDENAVVTLDLHQCPGSDFYYYKALSKIGDIDILSYQTERKKYGFCEIYQLLFKQGNC